MDFRGTLQAVPTVYTATLIDGSTFAFKFEKRNAGPGPAPPQRKYEVDALKKTVQNMACKPLYFSANPGDGSDSPRTSTTNIPSKSKCILQCYAVSASEFVK